MRRGYAWRNVGPSNARVLRDVPRQHVRDVPWFGRGIVWCMSYTMFQECTVRHCASWLVGWLAGFRRVGSFSLPTRGVRFVPRARARGHALVCVHRRYHRHPGTALRARYCQPNALLDFTARAVGSSSPARQGPMVGQPGCLKCVRACGHACVRAVLAYESFFVRWLACQSSHRPKRAWACAYTGPDVRST